MNKLVVDNADMIDIEFEDVSMELGEHFEQQWNC